MPESAVANVASAQRDIIQVRDELNALRKREVELMARERGVLQQNLRDAEIELGIKTDILTRVARAMVYEWDIELCGPLFSPELTPAEAGLYHIGPRENLRVRRRTLADGDDDAMSGDM